MEKKLNTPCSIVVSDQELQGFTASLDVAACYLLYQGSLLLLKRAPHKPEGDKWGVPAGKVEKGEDLADAAVRELYEETAIEIADLDFLGTLFIQKPEISYRYHMFYYSCEERPKAILNDEHQEARWVVLDQVAQLPVMQGGIEALRYFRDKCL